MKKFIYAIFAIALLSVASCANNGGGDGPDASDPNSYCWKVTVSIMGMSEDTYVQSTGAIMEQTINITKQGWVDAGLSGGEVTAVKADDSKCALQ